MAHDLDVYSAKRDFLKTPEPAARGGAKRKAAAATRQFVVQHHLARRDHFDFRLEIAGTLKSWAVTRGPSANPKTRRLAVRTEDHPLDYASFEGVIPPKSYGAGPVMLWDRGTWFGPSDEEALQNLSEGHLKFTLNGERMHGRWALVRMGPERGKENWLLVKDRDQFAEDDDSIATRFTTSVATGRSFPEIEKGAPPKREKKAAAKKPKKAPRFVPPMLCTLVASVPSGDEWLYEMKYDGYRMQLVTGPDGVTIFTRTGLDWTERFADIATVAATLPPAVLDGEIVVFDENGISDFAALAATLGPGPAAPMTFVAFDVLRAENREVTKLPLVKRKELLAGVLAKFEIPEFIRIAPTMQGDGQQLLQRIAERGGEGLIAKKVRSVYVSGRSQAWLKIKSIARQDVTVIGYTPSLAGRSFASLAVARYEDGNLRYAGRVGTGFTARKEADLWARLKPLGRAKPPEGVECLEEVPPKVRWVEPELIVAVRHRGVTGGGLLRAASYLGLREDMTASEVEPDTKPAPEKPSRKSARARTPSEKPKKVPLTNAARVIYPGDGITKGDLADYYTRAAKLMLPHLTGRPISVVRAPDGLGADTFFQRHPMPAMKMGIMRVPDPGKSHKDYMAVDSAEGIATVVQFGGIELHGWGSRLPDLTSPDRLVFDLDPDEDLPFKTVCESAVLVRDILTGVGLKSFVLATGGKGLHVVVPLGAKQPWADVEAFAEGVARHLSRLEPQSFVANARKEKRKGRIFIDWLRNKLMASAIMPYSARARPGATVAVPLTWSDLSTLDSARPYSIKTAPLTGRQPWTGYFKIDQAIAPGAIDLVRR